MSKTGLNFFRVIAAIVLLAVIFGGGAMAFHAGQAQGYALGLSAVGAAGSDASEQLKPSVPYYPMMPGYPFHPFMGFFGIIPVLIGLMIVLSIFKHLILGFPHRGFCRCSGKFYRHPFWDYEKMEDEEKSDNKTSENSEKA
ncbi:MAG: hypothetical protein GYA12_12100 [Chloroflexi bacterium]|jgi:hypothetical protein|nr:hypothetical protein [Chloroflexota bacterium]BCY17716.1 hypothetical protein hrd7_15650 [Leptolinea sp. HRD-7]